MGGAAFIQSEDSTSMIDDRGVAAITHEPHESVSKGCGVDIAIPIGDRSAIGELYGMQHPITEEPMS